MLSHLPYRYSQINTRLNSIASQIAFKTYATMTDHSKWKFNHTMLRVKDPKKSVEFYSFLGMKQINKISQPEAKFDLVSLLVLDNGVSSIVNTASIYMFSERNSSM
jgi:hypothetical protein